MNRFRKSQQGFTLVELLVVVAIIGILAAIAIPQFTKYKRNAAVAQCNSDLKNCMSEAAAMYAHNSTNDEACNMTGNRFTDLTAVKFNVNGTTGVITITGSTTNATWSGINVNYNITDNKANCTFRD